MLRKMMLQARNARKLWPRVASNNISNSIQSPVKYQICSQVNELHKSTWSAESTCSTSSSLLPLSILTFLGVGVSGLLVPAYAQEPAKPDILENKASHERRRLEELIKSKGSYRGAYPQFSVTSRGENITIKFKIPPKCDVSQLIIDLVSHLGLKAESQDDISSEMLIRAWENAAAWQVTLTYPNLATETSKPENNLCVFMYESLVGPEFCEIEFIKNGSFSDKELEALASVMKLAGGLYAKSPTVKNPRASKSRKEVPIEKSISDLEAMGVRVYGLDDTSGVPMDGGMSWDNLAGYEEQKREIEDTILLALQRPEIYDDIARGTRRKFESNRPKAVLFEGPPGTGKTSSARVIAKQAGVPLLYVPLEVIMSKYYGESERLLGNVFKLADDLPNGALVFLDEVDSFAVARDSEMHEATRRILSVLLRQIDGFEQEKQVVVIAATNRKDDLDPALISRFDSIICFDLPDQKTRKEIVSQYAKHLDESDMVKFAVATENMSGRDIRDVCQQAERHWASKLIRGIVPFDSEGKNLPPIDEYIKCAEQRQRALLKTNAEVDTETNSGWKWKPRALA